MSRRWTDTAQTHIEGDFPCREEGVRSSVMKRLKDMGRTAIAGGLVLLGAAVFMVVGQAASPTLEDRLFFRVESSFRQKKFSEAAQDVERVMKLNPRHTGARFYRALLLEQSGKKEDAARLLKSLLSDPQFGGLAKDRLFTMNQEKRTEGQNQSIQSYLEGGGYTEALRECKKALNEGRRDEPLLVQTILSAALTGDLRYAEAALTTMKSTGQPIAELRTFLDGWSVRTSSPREAVERLMAISDKRLLVWHVRQEIRRLLRELQLFDDYERYLQAERKGAGADINAIDHELMRLYIEQGLYEKAMTMLESRPLESIADNLMYLELMVLTGRETEAMKISRNLMQIHADEEALHEWWVKAYLHYVERVNDTPTGSDDSGMKLADIALQEVERVLKRPAEGEETRKLFYGTRLAAVLGQETFLKGLTERIQKAPLSESLASEALLTSRLLGEKGFRHHSVKILESSLAQRPDDADFQYALAEEYFLENRSAEAVTLLEGVVAHDSTRLRAYLLLIDALAACGRVDDAHQRAIDRMNDPSLPDLVAGQIKSRAILLADQITQARKDALTGVSSGRAAPVPAPAASAESVLPPAWPSEPVASGGSEVASSTGD